MERENRQIRRADYRAGYSDTRGGAADAGGAENRTSAGRKEHRHYRRFAGIAAAVAVLVIAVGTYGWNKYGTDDAQPKKAALSVTETVDSTQDTEKKEQIGAFTLAKSYQDVYAAVQKNPIHKRSWQKAQWMICFRGRYRFCRGEKESSGTHSDTNLQVNGVDEGTSSKMTEIICMC